MSGRRITALERARIEERERCVDQLLDMAGEMLSFATAYPSMRSTFIEQAMGYYAGARALSPLAAMRDWPMPSEWATWAARACGAEERA
jgi:hypothetical protein